MLTGSADLSSMMGGMMDAGSNCTSSSSGCKFDLSCSEDAGGIGLQISATFNLGTNSATGQETIVSNFQGGSINCMYNITLTKN
jgi:hypothetical protein